MPEIMFVLFPKTLALAKCFAASCPGRLAVQHNCTSGVLQAVLDGLLGNTIAQVACCTPSWTACSETTAAMACRKQSWAACCAVKKGTRIAFHKKRRAMSALDVSGEIGEVLDSMEGGLELELCSD